MPVYEYRCRSCQYEFDVLLKGASRPVRTMCPSCGSRQVERKLSVFAARGSDSAPPCSAAEVVPADCRQCGERGGTCPLQIPRS